MLAGKEVFGAAMGVVPDDGVSVGAGGFKEDGFVGLMDEVDPPPSSGGRPIETLGRTAPISVGSKPPTSPSEPKRPCLSTIIEKSE